MFTPLIQNWTKIDLNEQHQKNCRNMGNMMTQPSKMIKIVKTGQIVQHGQNCTKIAKNRQKWAKLNKIDQNCQK